MVVTVAIVASRDRSKPAAHEAAPMTVVGKDVEPRADAAIASALTIVVDAGASTDVQVRPAEVRPAEAAPDAAVARPKADKRRGPDPELAKMINDAEAAQRAGNRLRQMALADSALRIDPRNVRARLLLADALIATGDHDRGCKYLHDLGRHAAAVARAKQAGCVGN
jgi:hypothetical protein